MYGDLQGYIAKPVLEIKEKRGYVGRKRSFALRPFTLIEGYSKSCIKEVIDNSVLPTDVKIDIFNLNPILLTRYCRKYYLSSDRKFRITIDSNLFFYRFLSCYNRLAISSTDHEKTILELKYTMKHDDEASTVTSKFPWRIDKNSKYVTGLEQLYEM